MYNQIIMKSQLGELVFFWILIGVTGFLTFLVMRPYLTPLFLAVVFAMMFTPLYSWLFKITKGKETLSAFFTVLIVFCAAIIPLIFLSFVMFQEVHYIYDSMANGNSSFAFINNMFSMLQERIHTIVPSFDLPANFSVVIEKGLGWVSSNLDKFFSGALSFVFQSIIIFVAMFFFYRNGKKLRALIAKWSPLPNEYDEKIITTIEGALNSVIMGALAGSFVQGILVGVGFAIFGIPNPVLGGFVAAIAAFVPVIGSGIITVPLGIFMIVSGNYISGMGLLLWVFLLVASIDNFTRPFVMGRGIKVHPFIIFLSVIGGLSFFGPVGLIAGPVTVACLFALFEIYPMIVVKMGS